MTATVHTDVIAPSEIEAVRLLADGLTVRQAARHLNVQNNTVSMRLRRAGDKLGTTTTVQTVLECQRRGLLGPDNHRANRIRRELADRHASTCALLAPPVCDCSAEPPIRS